MADTPTKLDCTKPLDVGDQEAEARLLPDSLGPLCEKSAVLRNEGCSTSTARRMSDEKKENIFLEGRVESESRIKASTSSFKKTDSFGRNDCFPDWDESSFIKYR